MKVVLFLYGLGLEVQMRTLLGCFTFLFGVGSDYSYLTCYPSFLNLQMFYN